MKLLILTQYYPPEIGAPQNRLHELALRLKNSGVEVDVFTAMPNYPSMKIHDSYKRKIYSYEEIDGIKVRRSWIFVSKSKSVPARLLNYFSFVFSSIFFGLVSLSKRDYIMCESPPLFLGISAYLLSKFKGASMIFNVSDLWPESAEKLDIISNKRLLKMATRLEEFCFRKSKLITGQTQGIVKNISERFPNKRVYWLPNGVDLSYYDPSNYDQSWRKENGFEDEDILVAYAGIIGHAQALEVILRGANELRDNKHLKFILLGSGPEKEKLLKLNEEIGNTNVTFLDPITKKEMPAFVSSIDISVIPLKNIPLFEGAIPSKIFENLAMEKPILLGVKGEAKELFIDNGKAGVYFEPENHMALANALTSMVLEKDGLKEFGKRGRAYVEQNFNRNHIAKKFKEELESIK